jgi:hypothetical protein
VGSIRLEAAAQHVAKSDVRSYHVEATDEGALVLTTCVHFRCFAARWTTFAKDRERRLVDGRRLELPTSALRTRRSPS